MEQKEIIEKVENRVRKELEGKIDPNKFGYIHFFEERKKEILEKEYGIIFQTSIEKNKSCNID